MIARLTALIISLCIGLPMCWCCIVAPQREATKGCCAMRHHAASEKSPTPDQDRCPCAKHEDMRDVAATFVKIPAPALKLLAEPAWYTFSSASLIPAVYAIPAPRHDHGPPLHAAPLYARHCALLI